MENANRQRQLTTNEPQATQLQVRERQVREHQVRQRQVRVRHIHSMDQVGVRPSSQSGRRVQVHCHDTGVRCKQNAGVRLGYRAEEVQRL